MMLCDEPRLCGGDLNVETVSPPIIPALEIDLEEQKESGIPGGEKIIYTWTENDEKIMWLSLVLCVISLPLSIVFTYVSIPDGYDRHNAYDSFDPGN